MFDKIKLIETLRILLGGIILAFGIVFLAAPSLSVQTVVILLGIAISVRGTTLILSSSYPKSKGFYSFTDFTLGCVLFAYGIIVMINTNISLFFVGIFVILFAFILMLNQGLICYERRVAGLKFEVAIVFGIIHGIFGGLIVYSISFDFEIFNTVMGTYLLSVGALIIVSIAHLLIASEPI